MALEEKRRIEDQRSKIGGVLEGLPEGMREAILARDMQTLNAALGALPEEQATQILQQLREAGIISSGESSSPDIEQVLEEFEPLLQAIAAVARGEVGEKAEIEKELANLQEKGWMLVGPVQRIWAGEREEPTLTGGLDDQDAALIRRVLEILSRS
ncbi:MAG TPA: hypothetical protein VI451_19365, partial [Anaerolineales bacterium]|nr:hypothetical protein [Anaerolineales bacterium]